MSTLGVIFDFDGVVSDSMPNAYRGVRHVFERSGLAAPSYTEFVTTIGSPYIEWYRARGVTAAKEQISVWYHEKAEHHAAPLFPDVGNVVRHLAKAHGAHLGIVSANRTAIIEKHLTDAGIRDLVPYVVGSTDDKVDAIREFKKAFRLGDRDVWFIGDLVSDVRDAIAAGVRPIGITRGAESEGVLLMAGAEHCVRDLAELLTVVCCVDPQWDAWARHKEEEIRRHSP